MEHRPNIKVENIFRTQEELLKRNINEFSNECKFITDCIELVLNRQFVQSNITEKDAEKLGVIHLFLNDAISSIINSFKLCLYGCLSDSGTLLRPALEELVIMNYIVEKGIYKIAAYEIKRKLKKLQYEQVVIKVKSSAIIQKLHGQLSDLASHGTASRVRANLFNLHGKKFPTVGMALQDSRKTRRALILIINTSLYMIRIITDLYSTKKEIISPEYFSLADGLNERHKSLSLSLK